ncbi:ROK family transcriptional regulator [Pseudonocardia sp. GCM10023141]|uniref:ROK family transcriptional regulator n=1 Tax=Pseudonocardia sp. GCM10023141 TaxID=3252653 RepID=UPI0036120F56
MTASRGVDMRRQNLALVLGEVADREPLSRAQLAQRTGLTRSTVSSLVEQLLLGGFLTELGATASGPGRPANPLQLNRSGPAGLGLEVGVDHVGACVVDLAGQVRAQQTAPSQHRDREPAVALERAAALAVEVTAQAGLGVAAVTVALPGVVGHDGVLQRAPNLPRWADVAVSDQLSNLFDGLPVSVGNEADLAALAERWFGGAPADFLHVSGEIGVGGGIVLDGQLFAGPGGRAGEIGHVVVDPDGPPCSCGGRGCLEQAAGQEALLRAADVPDVAALVARGGEPRPAAAIATAGRALGVALAGAVNLLDLPAVVLGGLYARLGAPLLEAVTVELSGRVAARPVQIRLSTLGADGALRGAATAAVREQLRDPTVRVV